MQSISPHELISLLRATAHGRDVALIEQLTRLVQEQRSIAINLATGEVWASEQPENPPRITVVYEPPN